MLSIPKRNINTGTSIVTSTIYILNFWLKSYIVSFVNLLKLILNMILKILHCLIQVELMKEMVDRSYEIEENKSGLLIQRAIFGKLCGDERLIRFL